MGKMTTNLIFDSLDEGWYSIGIKGMWNSANIGQNDINVHVYSSDTPVHIYDGETVVSTQRTGEYVPPAPPSQGSGGGGGGGSSSSGGGGGGG